MKDCTASFRREDHLAIHIKSHGSIREFKCVQEDCSKAYYTKDKLNRHLKKHDEIATLSIVNLDHSSQHQSTLPKQPSSPVHPGSDSSQGHESIRTSSINLKDLQKVADEIVKERPYACTWEGCTKRFNKHQKLKAHVCMVHEGRRPYPCTHEDCEMSFQTPSKLRKHQLVHSGRSTCNFFFFPQGPEVESVILIDMYLYLFHRFSAVWMWAYRM